ncbi:energy transducer TonB [Mariniphaga sp.]|uniref:energy transducer TonB n=1 Tax=Mariniphaga sp. TaxID=1954475 RepID=UPI0035653C2F
MKYLAHILFFFLPLFLSGQNDTVLFFGPNGKMNSGENPVLKKEIKYRGKNRVRINTEKLADDGSWTFLFTERVRRKSTELFHIRIKGQEFSEQIERRFEPQSDGTQIFTDLQNDQIKRTGLTQSKIPLIFHGKLTEYYPNGNVKSISVYENNELISNQNWKENGDNYIDNIFYSVEREPRFLRGTQALHQHVLKTFKESEVDLSQMEGRLVVGFVVMENGEIDGIRIERGLGLDLNNLALTAFHTLRGEWQPAMLNGESVRFYQLFPINFIYRKFDFDYLEMRGSMLYWEIN